MCVNVQVCEGMWCTNAKPLSLQISFCQFMTLKGGENNEDYLKKYKKR